MALFDAPDAVDDHGDVGMWFAASHSVKLEPDDDRHADHHAAKSPVDVVADFDLHHAFVTTAAATIKMEIDSGIPLADDSTDGDKEIFDEEAFSLGLMQLETAGSSPVASVSASVSSPEPMSATTDSMTDLERRKQLSIERRRKRNREAMQRSRQRDKDYMDGLRDQAAELERVHNSLVEQMNQRLSLASEDSSVAELQAQLEGAREQAQALMEQNLKFQDEITERIKSEDRMEGLLKEMLKDQQRNAGALSAILYDHMAPRVSISRAMDLIMMGRKKLECIRKKRFTIQAHFYNFFGWEIRHYFLEKYLYMKFTKVFRNRTAEEISDRAWNHARQMVGYRTKLAPRKITQHINEDTFISAIDKRDPDNAYEFVRVYNLRYRVREPDGVICIGTYTLPESFCESSLENVWASDICMAILLTPVQECDLATGEIVEHCHVEFVGKTRFGAHQLAQQNALETVISLARWEESNVGTTQRLLWTES